MGDYVKEIWAIWAISWCQFKKKIQLTKNETGRLVGNIEREVTELLNKMQLSGQTTDVLDTNLKELSIAIAKRNQENFGNNAQNQTMGVAESQVVIAPCSKNTGIKLEKGATRKELRQAYAPSSSDVPGEITHRVLVA